MKKYLVLLIIPFLFFSTGCEEDEDLSEISTVVSETLSLDSDLFGNWYFQNSNTQYVMTLSSNGNFVWDQNVTLSGYGTYYDEGGIWWVEGSHLILKSDGFNISSPYTVSGNTLEFNNKTWEKVD